MTFRLHLLGGLTAGLLAFGPGVAHAATVTLDFEGLGLGETDAVTFVDGVTITGAQLVVPGNPRTAFGGNSSGAGSGNDDDAGTGDSLRPFTKFGTVSFLFPEAATQVSIDMLDVELGSVQETVNLSLFSDVDGTNLVASLVYIGPSGGAGDGTAITVALANTVGALRLDVTKLTGPVGSDTSGYAMDNLTFDIPDVPLPASLPLLAAGFGALVATRRRIV